MKINLLFYLLAAILVFNHKAAAGGLCNVIKGNCNAIVGGCNNLLSGAFSSVLGGSGNTDSGYSYVGISGKNILAVCDNVFHANCLWLGSLFRGTTAPGYAFGTVWVDTTGGNNVLKII